MKLLSVILAVFMTTSAHAQLPEAPRPQTVLLVGEALVRGLDVYSTHRAYMQGNREVCLPNAIAHHTLAMAAYSEGIVILDWQVSRFLDRHHHKRLALLLPLVDIAVTAPFAIRNLRLKQVPPSKTWGSGAPVETAR